jgi:hypothetical protein
MSSYAKILLRSSRFAVRGSKSNPLHFALGKTSSYQYNALSRGYAAAAFSRDKPHVNVGMFGWFN